MILKRSYLKKTITSFFFIFNFATIFLFNVTFYILFTFTLYLHPNKLFYLIMDFNNVATTYNSASFGTPMIPHRQQQPGFFINQLSASTTTSVHTTNNNIHPNLPHYYLPQSLDFLDKQLTMRTTMTDQTTPSNRNNNNKKKPKRKQVKNACGKYIFKFIFFIVLLL